MQIRSVWPTDGQAVAYVVARITGCPLVAASPKIIAGAILNGTIYGLRTWPQKKILRALVIGTAFQRVAAGTVVVAIAKHIFAKDFVCSILVYGAHRASEVRTNVQVAAAEVSLILLVTHRQLAQGELSIWPMNHPIGTGMVPTCHPIVAARDVVPVGASLLGTINPGCVVLQDLPVRARKVTAVAWSRWRGQDIVVCEIDQPLRD
jgi:hypothetical protein